MEDESGGTEPARRGLGASLRGLATGALGLVATHVELIGVELQEEKHRLIEVAVFGACALALLAMALLLATFGIVAWFWDTHRMETIVCLTVFYAALGAWALFTMQRKLEAHPNPFASTASELEKDRERLQP
jgi:uncharacterized membrane protein YqjE